MVICGRLGFIGLGIGFVHVEMGFISEEDKTEYP